MESPSQVHNMEVDNKSQVSDDDDVIWIEDISRVLDNADFSAILKDDDGPPNGENASNCSKTTENNDQNAAKGSKTGEENKKNTTKDLREHLRNKLSQDSRPCSYWGRGYGPHGPPIQQRPPREHKNVEFLTQCGIMKGTVKALPNALLKLMGRDYCGVCALSFDNLDGARLHYTSKKHLKIQKRWLVQQNKVGFRHPKEMPMRARELYCELCDVDMKSKIHAESHYAGRPHRSIVEGCRLPKNPFLLQENMQERVNKLILREKKCLSVHFKTVDSKKAKAETKPVPSELFCEICKTTVTTMEQMTMHLNGKRHLKNEKNHILKIMKSGIPEAKEQPQPDTSKGVDAHDKNVNEEDYDWGDGSCPWDDDPQ